MIGGWAAAGLSLMGMAVSPWLPLTVLLMAVHTRALVAGGMAMGTLIGGWLADLAGAASLFAPGGMPGSNPAGT